ncbi:MAG: MBL fold metallo-hydrolase [Deltaproteobacteria bacterium]|nr:MBL fold metallo-hydrolase [Deltaproteobacteria bacterium]
MTSTIEFHGAAETVTGSRYLVRAGDETLQVDCGLYQGQDDIARHNRDEWAYEAREVDHLILTHAHIDHAGLTPRMVREGFKGAITTTPASSDLAEIMLPDSARIMMSEVEWHNRKNQRRGRPTEEPLYDEGDARRAVERLAQLPYGREGHVGRGFAVTLIDAGHILGSATACLKVKANGTTKRIVFSGDVGDPGKAVVRDPAPPPAEFRAPDVIVIESTYGNRLHKDHGATVDELCAIIRDAYKRGGKVIIPAFALGRTQEILYHIKEIQVRGQLPRIPVFVDSPLASSATGVFRKNPDCFDDETKRMIEKDGSPFEFKGLTFVQSPKESMALNERKGPAVIISASGMCEAGRIKHHLKHNLWRDDATIVFVGYQAQGTLGHRIIMGAEDVKILGEEVAVRAKVVTLGGFSAHADKNGLLNWLRRYDLSSTKVCVTHGEPDSARALAKAVIADLHADAVVPTFGESLDV